MKKKEQRERILEYNNLFFGISQTFIYNQLKFLSGHYDVDLIAKNYANPHNFDISSFDKYRINHSRRVFDRAFNKIARSFFHNSINVDVKSLFLIHRLLLKKKYKAIHAQFGINGVEILPFAKLHKVPLVVTFRGYDASQKLSDRQYKDKLPDLFDYASAIILVSSHMIETLKLTPWLHKVHVIPSAVDPDQFFYENRRNGSEKIKILHSGRFTAKKGVPDLISVFSKLREKHQNIELHLIGEGSEMAQCRKLVTGSNIEDHVRFYGALSHEEVRCKMSEADIFVLNSRTDEEGDMEGTPTSLMEAMYMEKAVLSTRHAGIPFLVDHEKNGILVNERANDELYDSLEMLILQPELRVRLGKKAKQKIEAGYTTEVMGKKIKKVFDDL